MRSPERRKELNNFILKKIKEDNLVIPEWEDRILSAIEKTNEDILITLEFYIKRVELYAKYTSNLEKVLSDLKELFMKRRQQ